MAKVALKFRCPDPEIDNQLGPNSFWLRAGAREFDDGPDFQAVAIAAALTLECVKRQLRQGDV